MYLALLSIYLKGLSTVLEMECIDIYALSGSETTLTRKKGKVEAEGR